MNRKVASGKVPILLLIVALRPLSALFSRESARHECQATVKVPVLSFLGTFLGSAHPCKHRRRAEVPSTLRVVAASPVLGHVVEILGWLVEQSLVMTDRDEKSGKLRYGIPEPVRQYAREKVKVDGTDHKTEQQHFASFPYLAEQADRTYGLLTGMRVTGTDGEAWIDTLAREHDNLRAAPRSGAMPRTGSGSAAP